MLLGNNPTTLAVRSTDPDRASDNSCPVSKAVESSVNGWKSWFLTCFKRALFGSAFFFQTVILVHAIILVSIVMALLTSIQT